jgi:hypothetical protein
MKMLALVLLGLHFTVAPSIPLWACFVPLLLGAAIYVGGLAIIAVAFAAVFKPFG